MGLAKNSGFLMVVFYGVFFSGFPVAKEFIYYHPSTVLSFLSQSEPRSEGKSIQMTR